MPHSGRDRVTVDLRGAGALVQQRAAAQGLTMAAFVRRAVLESVEQPVPSVDIAAAASGTSHKVIKVTLRLPVAHAELLATRARRADVSQGVYVTRLLDGIPPPPATPARAEALLALLRSTDQLAVISADLNCFMRLLRQGSSAALEAYRAGVMSLPDDVRRHLHIASQFLREVRGAAAGRPRAKRP